MLGLMLKYISVICAFLAVYVFIQGFARRKSRGESLALALARVKARWIRRTGVVRGNSDPAWDAERTFTVGLIAAACGAGLGVLAGGLSAGGLLLALGSAAAGFLAPRLLLRARMKRRRLALDRQLPDVLELTANSLRAGLSLVQALEVVAREAPKPVAEEFTEVLQDVRLGRAPEDSLGKLTLRWPNADLELFVTAAEVSRRTGGNLAEVASQIVGTVRERMRLKGRITALTSQGVLSGWVVGLLPVGLLVAMSLLDPELIGGFIRHPMGWVMLAAGGVMELAGALFIRKLVRIDA